MKKHMGWLVAAAMLAASPAALAASGHLLTQQQARQLARLTARHEHIDLNNEWIEFDSMDMGAPYVPGFASFIVLQDASTPGPDKTLRHYAVNRRSGNVWEMTLCLKYDFPALAALRKQMTGHAEPSKAENAAEQKELGCAEGKSVDQR